MTSLAMAVASLVLVNWLAWQNRLDLDHQAFATMDIMATLAKAYDHYGHDSLQLATPGIADSQRELTAAEIAAFHGHAATPPWLRSAVDDLSGNWNIHYLVHYRSGSELPWMILNFVPSTGLENQLVNRIRNQFSNRFDALVSGGTSTVREGFAENVRMISETVRGSALDDGEIAIFSWPLAGINGNWLPREERAGVSSGTLMTGLNLGNSHDIVGTNRFGMTGLDVSGGLSAGTATTTLDGNLSVTGNGTAVDMLVRGNSILKGTQTITHLTATNLRGIDDLTLQSSFTGLQGIIDEIEVEGKAEITGDITGTGTILEVDGDVTSNDGFARTLDAGMNLSFDSLEVRGFIQVDDEARVGTVTISGSGSCIGCQFSDF